MQQDASYLKNLWGARHFWMHLALADIRSKYRRSLLGILWATLHPLLFTVVMSFIMGNLFHAKMENYAPFIFSGIIVWETVINATMSGCHAFTNAAGYIKQFRHPLLVYTLRTVIPCLINLFYAMLGLFVWILIWKPANFLHIELVSLLLFFPLLFFFIWPLSTVNAFIGVKFHDFSQLLTILLQMVYFISPIMFPPEMFASAHLKLVLAYNPVYHLLNLFRAPLLYGTFPTLDDYLCVILMSFFLWLCTWLCVRSSEKKVIFYL